MTAVELYLLIGVATLVLFLWYERPRFSWRWIVLLVVIPIWPVVIWLVFYETRGKRLPPQSQRLTEAEMARRARLRPPHYPLLSAEKQWEVDKRLGILDWSGREGSE